MAAPPTVGTLAPAITLPGAPTFLGNDTLVLFMRGTWCPFCVAQLGQLTAHWEALQAARVGVVAISCQSAASLASYLAKNPVPFPVLADEKRVVARAYGTHYWLRYEGFNLSHPALFFVDRAGRVAFVYVEKRMDDLPIGALLEKFLLLLGVDLNTG